MQDWHYQWAKAALRVAKPGAILMAFGGTRTWHRLACAIEDAGWELRDTMMWLYGSGFPKSHDISKAIDKAAGAEREVVGKYQPPNGTKWDLRQANDDKIDHAPGTFTASGTRTLDITSPATALAAKWDGWGTSLKPAWESIIVAMAPRDGTFAENAEKWGVAGLWIDGGRVPTDWQADRGESWLRSGKQATPDGDWQGPSLKRDGSTVADRVSSLGRWPANLLLDEEAAAMLDEQSGELKSGDLLPGHKRPFNFFKDGTDGVIRKAYGGDSGGASRFFYCAKASRAERNAGLEGMEERAAQSTGWSGDGMPLLQDGTERKMPHKQNHHPTVKPISLLRYLCRLTKTPTGGVVLDPFMGSGSTGCAAVQEGRDFIGIELDAEYCEIARRRIEHWARQPVLEMV